jgi:hypothetical protein
MKRFFTQWMYEYSDIKKRNPKIKHQPSKQTLDFLTQFARVYKVEPALQQDICSYVLN